MVKVCVNVPPRRDGAGKGLAGPTQAACRPGGCPSLSGCLSTRSANVSQHQREIDAERLAALEVNGLMGAVGPLHRRPDRDGDHLGSKPASVMEIGTLPEREASA